MQQEIFAVYDEKAEAFMTPFFLQTIAMAIRAITDCVNDPSHNFGAHPADYTLFHIGTYDTQTSVIVSCKKSLGNGVEFKTQTVMFENDTSRTKLEDAAQLKLASNLKLAEGDKS